jgi:hypothetical protein
MRLKGGNQGKQMGKYGLNQERHGKVWVSKYSSRGF